MRWVGRHYLCWHTPPVVGVAGGGGRKKKVGQVRTAKLLQRTGFVISDTEFHTMTESETKPERAAAEPSKNLGMRKNGASMVAGKEEGDANAPSQASSGRIPRRLFDLRPVLPRTKNGPKRECLWLR